MLGTSSQIKYLYPMSNLRLFLSMVPIPRDRKVQKRLELKLGPGQASPGKFLCMSNILRISNRHIINRSLYVTVLLLLG